MADYKLKIIVVSIVLLKYCYSSDILCETSYCRTYGFEVGCTTPSQHCRMNNATHSGLWLPSPTICNCCDYCLPFIGEDQFCSPGGPGTGTTVGRCGDGLTCTAGADGHSYCRRMPSACHTAQDDFDVRHARGETGALEQRPECDGKARYAAFDCVPTQSCFCQSEDGERLFGETLYLGAATAHNMHCGCSRLHAKIKKTISPGVPVPVIGPRCTSDGNFNPVQCVDRVCYCVNTITGTIREGERINLDEKPLSELSCYDPTLDLFPDNDDDPPYDYTTPCLESMRQKIELIEQSEKEGYNVDYFTTVQECMPDGTYGRIEINRNGTKFCVDEHGEQIENYAVAPEDSGFDSMDCKCAQTSLIMSSSNERPVCCRNGNFREVQCRRGQCRCVDSDGRQVGMESADVTTLSCYTEEWRTC